MNRKIRNLVEELIMQQAEQSVEGKQLIERHNRAVEVLYELKRQGLIDDEAIDSIENMPWGYGNVCAQTFFEWGLRIGANPAIALELPDNMIVVWPEVEAERQTF